MLARARGFEGGAANGKGGASAIYLVEYITERQKGEASFFDSCFPDPAVSKEILI